MSLTVPPPPLLDLQIIGLSATLPNLEEVAGWMDAALFHTTFRPVQLHETYKLGDGLYNAKGTLLRQLLPWRQEAQDPDHSQERGLAGCGLGCVRSCAVVRMDGMRAAGWGGSPNSCPTARRVPPTPAHAAAPTSLCWRLVRGPWCGDHTRYLSLPRARVRTHTAWPVSMGRRDLAL